MNIHLSHRGSMVEYQTGQVNDFRCGEDQKYDDDDDDNEDHNDNDDDNDDEKYDDNDKQWFDIAGLVSHGSQI